MPIARETAAPPSREVGRLLTPRFSGPRTWVVGAGAMRRRRARSRSRGSGRYLTRACSGPACGGPLNFSLAGLRVRRPPTPPADGALSLMPRRGIAPLVLRLPPRRPRHEPMRSACRALAAVARPEHRRGIDDEASGRSRRRSTALSGSGGRLSKSSAARRRRVRCDAELGTGLTRRCDSAPSSPDPRAAVPIARGIGGARTWVVGPGRCVGGGGGVRSRGSGRYLTRRCSGPACGGPLNFC